MGTPGKRAVRVREVKSDYTIKQGGRRAFTVSLLDDSGIHMTARCITERIDHKRDCPILVTGDRGAGKSTLIAKVARHIDPDLPVENVAFRLAEFEQIFQKNPEGDGDAGLYPQVWLDEAGFDLYGPEWLKQEQRMIAKMLIIGRIKKQIMWFTVPKRMQLNNQVREMPYMWIHVAEQKEYEQGLAYVRVAPPELQSEWFSQRYWIPRYAFIFTEDDSDWWRQYEKRKIAFVDEVAAMTADRQNRGKTSNEVLYAKNLRKRGLSQTEIAEILGKGQATISRMLATEV